MFRVTPGSKRVGHRALHDGDLWHGQIGLMAKFLDCLVKFRVFTIGYNARMCGPEHQFVREEILDEAHYHRQTDNQPDTDPGEEHHKYRHEHEVEDEQ